MNRRLIAILLSVMTISAVYSQDRKVENRPYVDLRPFHFGVLVGTHLQDIEMLNVGPQMIEQEDGTMAEKLISCDQDRWDAGFNVGVLGELRLSTHFQRRQAFGGAPVAEDRLYRDPHQPDFRRPPFQQPPSLHDGRHRPDDQPLGQGQRFHQVEALRLLSRVGCGL